MTGATAGAAAVGTSAGTGMTIGGIGGGLGATALGAAKTAAELGLGVGVSEGAKALTGKPDMPQVPGIDPKYAPPAEKIAAPSAPPTEGVATSNAFKAEERRRLLAGLPQQTQSVFTSAAGAPGKAKVNKPKLLGGGVGQMTAGV